MKKLIIFNSRDGLVRMDAERSAYFKASGINRFIVNLDYVYFVNMAKQCLVMSDMKHFAFQLPISKDALRKMKELMIDAKI